MRSKKKELSPESEAARRLQLFEEALREMLRLLEPAAGETREERDMLSRRGTEFIYRTLTEDVCRQCPKYRECFEKRREKTLAEIASILERAEAKARVDGRMASEVFRKRCVFFQPFMEEMSWLFRMLYQDRRWEKRVKGLHQVMRAQMLSQYLLMRECHRLLSAGKELEGAARRRLQSALLRRGFYLLEGREYKDEGGMINVTLTLGSLAGSRRMDGVLQALQRCYGRSFRSAGGETWVRSGRRTLSFVEEGGFQVIFGVCRRSKAGETVCGDTFSFEAYDRKRAVMLLSDGMGVGEEASRDSRRLIEAFEAMLEAGVHEEYALEILHGALLQKEKESCATLDAAVISLQTGTVRLLKAGGTATFIRHQNAVERIGPSGLPPGCLPEQGFDIRSRKLYDGDMIIMLSDGMLDFEAAPGQEVCMEDLIRQIRAGSAQRFAEELMRAVPVPAGGRDDDCTVLVAAVWERKPTGTGR